MKIRWTGRAARSLLDIVDFIAEDNHQAADRLVRKVKEALQQAAMFPRSGRMVTELSNADIREIVTGNYRIVYKIAQKTIDILIIFERHQLLPIEADEIE